MKVKDVDDMDEIGMRRYLVNMHTYTKNGVSKSSHLFAVHNRTFYTNERTYDLLANMFLSHRNGVSLY